MQYVSELIQVGLCVSIAALLSHSLNVHAQSDRPIKIRFAHVVAEETPKGRMALRFKQLVKERLGDSRVIVEVYPNGELFKDDVIGDEILKGNAELGAPSMSKIKKFSTRFQVLDIPFLFVTPEAADNFLQGPYGKRMLRLVEPAGLKGLGYLNNGMKQLSASQPIKTPQDVKGLKFRIMNSDVLEDQFKQVEALPIRKPFGQVYGLLKTGEIDGQENTWSNIYSKKFYEYQPYIVESNHGYLGYMIFSSVKFWNSLPNDIRPVVEQALADALEYGNQVANEKVVSDRQRILDTNKSEIHIMTLDERKAWVKAMQPVWQTYEDEIGSELIQAAASAR